MTNKERFEGINFKDNKYEDEARQRWGNQAVDEANAKLKGLSDEAHDDLSKRWDELFKKLALLREQAPESEQVQATIKEWYEFLNENFGHYSLDSFSGLGQLYVDDERFTENIDQYGDGLADFMCKAMKIFSGK